MMEALSKYGDRIAAHERQQQIERLARRLRGMLGTAAVDVEEARVLVRGRGIIKRWLVDPSLRFLSGEYR